MTVNLMIWARIDVERNVPDEHCDEVSIPGSNSRVRRTPQRSQPCGSYAKRDNAKQKRRAHEKKKYDDERGQARAQNVVGRRLVCGKRSYEGAKFVTGMCVVGSQVYLI